MPTSIQLTHGSNEENRYVKKLRSDKQYENLETVAKGEYGIIFSATNIATQKKVAVKTILRTDFCIESSEKEFRSEINLMETFDHHNIVRFIQADKQNCTFALEFAEGGDLYALVSRVGCLDERIAKHIFKQVVAAVDYLHDQLVVHRDIHMGNILLMTIDVLPVAKLTDFGNSQRLKEPCDYCEKRIYINQDIFDLSISLYESCMKKLPNQWFMKVEEITDEIQKVKNSKCLKHKVKVEPSKEFVLFLWHCLNPAKNIRLSAKKLKLHCWFEEPSAAVLPKMLINLDLFKFSTKF